MNNTVSICVSTHHEPVSLLKSCLDSIYAQNYPSIDLVVINDCSEFDDVAGFLDEYATTHSNFRHVNLKENVGYVKAKNLGAVLCKGEYFVFMDADQVLVGETYLQSMVDTLNLTPDTLCVSAPTLDININKTVASVNCIIYNGKGVAWGVGKTMFRRSLLDEIGYFHEVEFADEEFNIRLIAHSLKHNMETRRVNDGSYLYNHIETNRQSDLSEEAKGKNGIFFERYKKQYWG